MFGTAGEQANRSAWTSTIGTLLLLVVYLIVTAAAIKVLFFSGNSTVARWEIVIPVLAAVVLIYTLYRNIHPAGEPNCARATPLPRLHCPGRGHPDH
jgi:hypothetical protein